MLGLLCAIVTSSKWTANQFREDLYYRLNIVPLKVPPLRERKSDIPILASHFLSQFATEYDKKLETMSPDFMQFLVLQEWPGNVRELENKIQQLVVLAQPDETVLDDTQNTVDFSSSSSHLPMQHFKAKKSFRYFERTYIQKCWI